MKKQGVRIDRDFLKSNDWKMKRLEADSSNLSSPRNSKSWYSDCQKNGKSFFWIPSNCLLFGFNIIRKWTKIYSYQNRIYQCFFNKSFGDFLHSYNINYFFKKCMKNLNFDFMKPKDFFSFWGRREFFKKFLFLFYIL